ncbi:hypothetical protein CRUP_029416 [Coryphaenoides rupestris]|nr:hypothetical protein CRUP_029416 [Coryphaenoides rupestris]
MVVSDWLLPPWLPALLVVSTISLVVMATLCLGCRDTWPPATEGDYVNVDNQDRNQNDAEPTDNIDVVSYDSPCEDPPDGGSGAGTEGDYVNWSEDQDVNQNHDAELEDYIDVVSYDSPCEDPPDGGSGAGTEGDYVNWSEDQDVNQNHDAGGS